MQTLRDEVTGLSAVVIKLVVDVMSTLFNGDRGAKLTKMLSCLRGLVLGWTGGHGL